MTLSDRLSKLEAAAPTLLRMFFLGISPTGESEAEQRAMIDEAHANGEDFITIQFIGVKPNDS
jgi:hypothetical protein